MNRILAVSLVASCLCCTAVNGRAQVPDAAQGEQAVDWSKARDLLRRSQRGERLSREDQAYLDHARKLRERAGGGPRPDGASRSQGGKESYGLKPLDEMTADDRYQGEDGGLYGGGRNVPTAEHRNAAEAALEKIRPLDARGTPSAEGKIGFISISMSNATQEFSMFVRLAGADEAKAPQVQVVDCAQGGQAMAEWADPQARPWEVAMQRLHAADLSPAQVQVAWIKLANKAPRGDLQHHGRELQRDAADVIRNARARFPNLHIAYLSSRIYGGWSGGALNPEPYAYESGFVVRWLIQDQVAGNADLNFDPLRGDVKAPVLLWGPYLWADGVRSRNSDGLTWRRADLGPDGTHPSEAGREKVARLILDFCKTDPLAAPWFCRSAPAAN